MAGEVKLSIVAVGDDDPRWVDAHEFVYREYLSLGWCEPAEDCHVDDFRPFDAGSKMYIAYDPEGQMVATSRSVDGTFTPEENPTVAAVVASGVEVEPLPGLWRDVGGWVVAPEFRKGPLGTEMWRLAVADAAADPAYTGITCATHLSINAALDEVLGLPIFRMGGPIEHLGSTVQAAGLYVSALKAAEASVVEYFCDTEKRTLMIAPNGR